LAIARHGFRNFVCLSGHLGPRQLVAIEEAGLLIRRKNRRVSFAPASSGLVSPNDWKRSLFFPDPTEHGGARDTSIALDVVPNLVSSKFREVKSLGPEPGGLRRYRSYVLRKTSGYWGNPAAADLGQGKAALARALDQVYLSLKTVWAGARADRLFRSHYAVYPPNRSFFLAWLLTAGVGLVLIGWMLMWLQGL
jgi:creatinine amidohydrolase/Fe(II)-dependent formamide hydrolase-like protein